MTISTLVYESSSDDEAVANFGELSTTSDGGESFGSSGNEGWKLVVQNTFIDVFDPDSPRETTRKRRQSAPPALLEFQFSSDENSEGVRDLLTSVIVRNVPHCYTRAMLMELLDTRGFRGSYDFFYLPIEFCSGSNFGYAFVNFSEPETARTFSEKFEGFSEWIVDCSKEVNVEWSSCQGLAQLVDRYRNSPVMQDSVADECKPVTLRSGVRIEFPKPTKKVSTHGRVRTRRGLVKQAGRQKHKSEDLGVSHPVGRGQVAWPKVNDSPDGGVRMATEGAPSAPFDIRKSDSGTGCARNRRPSDESTASSSSFVRVPTDASITSSSHSDMSASTRRHRSGCGTASPPSPASPQGTRAPLVHSPELPWGVRPRSFRTKPSRECQGVIVHGGGHSPQVPPLGRPAMDVRQLATHQPLQPRVVIQLGCID